MQRAIDEGSGEAWLRSTPPEKARGSLAVARATQRASRVQVSYTRATHVRHIRLFVQNYAPVFRG